MVATIRFKGKYSDVSKYFGKLYGAVKGNASGSSFNCYYDDEYKELADIELCVPISKIIKSNEVEVKKLPKIRAICTTHKGAYENLNMAYKAVFDYAEEHGLKCITPSREIYEKGSGKIFKGNPDNYITHVIIPIEGESYFHWTSMIRQPEFVTDEVFKWACSEVLKKKPKVDISKARFQMLKEGACVQMMHIGPFDNEPETVNEIEDYIENNNLRNAILTVNENGTIRRHHEIYLSDPRKTDKQKIKTILRIPVK